METHKCLKCGHEWHPRSEKKPVQCPYCKNPKWDIPKKERLSKELGI